MSTEVDIDEIIGNLKSILSRYDDDFREKDIEVIKTAILLISRIEGLEEEILDLKIDINILESKLEDERLENNSNYYREL